MIRLLLVDEIRLYLEGLAQLLRNEPGIDVVATAAGADEAVRALREQRPDVVLLDVALPENAWLVRGLITAVPGTRIVALAVPDSEQEVVALAEAGIVGYVTRAASVGDLVAVVQAVTRGETLCSPRMVASLFQHIATLTLKQSPANESRLTQRELEILELIEEGLSNKEIARHLTIEISTVKNHVHNILQKLNVSSRTEAAVRARGQRSMLAIPSGNAWM